MERCGNDMANRVAVSSGRSFRIVSPPRNAVVTPQLAAELEHVFEKFAIEAGFDARRPVSISFRRGIFGHHQVGRAADIYGVGGIGIDEWKRRWERARQALRTVADRSERAAIIAAERRKNLGWRLYKAQQLHGRWAQPYGYPIQLFGPWTREEGPWKYISDRMLRAHLDHIHVAK
jgi:hypothetical protein